MRTYTCLKISPTVSSENNAIYTLQQGGSKYICEVYRAEPERYEGLLMKMGINCIKSLCGKCSAEHLEFGEHFSISSFLKKKLSAQMCHGFNTVL